MTRQETIDSLQKILNKRTYSVIIFDNAEAIEKAIKVLSEISDGEFEYLTFKIGK